jgi:hypothetical protein
MMFSSCKDELNIVLILVEWVSVLLIIVSFFVLFLIGYTTKYNLMNTCIIESLENCTIS